MDIKKELRKYINDNLKEKKQRKFSFFEKIMSLGEEDIDDLDYSMAKNKSIDTSYQTSNANNIESFLNQQDKYSDFQTLLFKFIDKKELKDADVYNKVHIDRRLFSKIKSDKNYHPSKETVILFGIALELTEDELEDLLEAASYSLPKNNTYDLIIRFCFINKIFNVLDINDLLYEYGCKVFSY